MPQFDGSIRSLSDYTELLLELQSRSGAPAAAGLWFRGHPDSRWQLRPGVLRDEFLERVEPPPGGRREEAALAAEIELNRLFRRRSATLVPRGSDLVDIYFLAQHHGLPSRLLDWTTSALAAIFFAVVDAPEVDGAVYVLEPEMVVGAPAHPLRGPPFSKRHPSVVSAVEFLFGEGERPRGSDIIPVFPELPPGRMEQQGSCFTLYLPGSAELDERLVRCYCVPGEAKQTLRRGLSAVGISWGSLFPDLDHLAREIRELLDAERGFWRRPHGTGRNPPAPAPHRP